MQRTSMISTQDILNISTYYTKIHHTPGRLRVKINKSIVDEVKNVSLDDITSLPKQVEGLNEIKVNKIMATATILYEKSIFAPSIWDNLIAGENLEEVVDILNKLQSKMKED